MKETDRGRDAGLLDLTSLSLSDLSRLDDSVVANALRNLLERRQCGNDYRARFENFESAL